MTWDGEIRLAPGITVSDAHTRTVRNARGGSYHLDEDTHAFVASLSPDWLRVQLSSDEQTLLSLRALSGARVIDTSPEFAGDDTEYHEGLADLVLAKESPRLTTLLHHTSRLLTPLLTATGITVGLVLFPVSVMLLVLQVSAAESWSTWVHRPWQTTAVVFVMSALRIVFHEAGHFGVARESGQIPPAGLGYYFTGPVLYVNLSCLDTEPLRVRLLGDLAGIALDGYVLAVVYGVLLGGGDVTHPSVRAGALALTMAALASLNPLYKSDLNWALRDLFSARAVTSSWSRPLSLLAAAREGGPSAFYARLTIALFAGFLGVVTGSLIKWIVDFRAGGVTVPTPGEAIPMALILVGLIVIHLTIKQKRERRES